MMKDKGKIALITGASRGLGKNTALALAKQGIGVIVTYHSSLSEANSVVSAIKHIGIALPVLKRLNKKNCSSNELNDYSQGF
ncbi:MAG: SDR family NAD(P)-dependent oxidoreductase [Leptolyngbyaceae cyanobacterium SM1_4_3]|nr:SDR family NAD(P)-dependent oxidoreductase [Leptolyngbyaceae cyanobacterium SM1_4_3]